MGRGKGTSCPSPLVVPLPWRLMGCAKFTETLPLQFSTAEDQSLIDEYNACWVEGFVASSREAISEVSEVTREGHVDELDLDETYTDLPSPERVQRRKKQKPKGKDSRNKPKLDHLDADHP